MKIALALAATAIVFGHNAIAENRVMALCGDGHVNEVAAIDDVVANPDGYFVHSLKTQISHGDPRIIQSTGTAFYLCTVSAATPDMEQTRALLRANARRVKYLFAPIDCPKQAPNS